MGKFKNYIIKEQIGLADLDSKISQVMNNSDIETQIGGALTHPAWTTPASFMDDRFDPTSTEKFNLDVPSVQKSGRITYLMAKKNPIYVRLSDGTECSFTYDQYRKIQGTPGLGKTMVITFQRHPKDTAYQYSKIDKAIVID